MAKTKKTSSPRLDASVLSALPLLNGDPLLMSEAHGRALLARVIQPLSRVPDDSDGSAPTLNVSGGGAGIAVIPIVGVLTKYPQWFDEFLGLCPTTMVESLIAQALGNDAVEEIILSIDTPGGFVNGTVSLADAVAAATTKKRVTGFVHGYCCSGGMYVASQCDTILARREAWVGNIGVYNVLADLTKLYEAMGIDLTLVTSGPIKGLGADGKVTDAYIAESQRLINGLYEQFLASVATGRKMTVEQIRPLADGRTFLGPEAKENGLIDDVVSTLDDAIQAVNHAADAAESRASMKTKTAPAKAGDDKGKDNKPDNKPDGDQKGAPTNDDVRSSLTEAKTSAESHTAKARAAMDNYKAMTDEPDSDTTEACKQCASSLKACAEESNRCAMALEGSEDDADEDEEGQQRQATGAIAQSQPEAFTAQQFMAAFGNQGAVWFLEKKSFAAATTEFITQMKAAHKLEVDGLKAENTKLSDKIKSLDLGNPAASFSVADGKRGQEQPAAKKPTGRQQYASTIKMPEKKPKS